MVDAANGLAPPAALTSFVGRAHEFAALSALVASDRVVSILGPGGSGKSRLAWELVGRRHERGGAWCFTELIDDVTSAAQVAERVAAALALPVGAGQDALAELCARLRDQDVLVTLDGCERAVEPIAQVVARLAASCPAVTFLVTSREPLLVAGETLYRLPPMTLPQPADLADPQAVATCDAVALFLVRSPRAPESLSHADGLLVAEICLELDGAPLAIELAAACLDHVELVDVARGLSDRFALLSRGPRGAPARHCTIAACIDWTHDLLGEPDRSVFRRLSVSAGPFGLAAATAVAGWSALDDSAVTAAVSRLVDRSLVERAPAAPDGTARYRLLTTLRAYGQRELDSAGERTVTSEAHLSWWGGLGRDARDALEGADAQDWLARLRYAADAGEWAAGADLITALTLFWHGAGLHREGLRHAQRTR